MHEEWSVEVGCESVSRWRALNDTFCTMVSHVRFKQVARELHADQSSPSFVHAGPNFRYKRSRRAISPTEPTTPSVVPIGGASGAKSDILSKPIECILLVSYHNSTSFQNF
eukprot:1180994-Prorocentrum_minimum.AAC.4